MREALELASVVGSCVSAAGLSSGARTSKPVPGTRTGRVDSSEEPMSPLTGTTSYSSI